MLHDKAINSPVISSFMNTQEKLIRTTTLNHQDIQITLHFTNEESVQTQPATKKQIISPIQTLITTPHIENNTAVLHRKQQSTANPTVFPNFSQIDCQL